MKRMRLRKKIKFRRKIKILIIIFIIIFLLLFLLSKFFSYVNPIIFNYAEKNINQLASVTVAKALNESLINDLNVESLYKIEIVDGKIKTIDYDMSSVNKILLNSLVVIRKNLNDAILSTNYNIPFGSVFNNPLFSDMAPYIHIKYNVVGDIEANLDNKIRNYGINSALIETVIKVSVLFDIVIPMYKKQIKSTMEIPLLVKIIEGDVPKYYLSGYNQSSSIFSLPVE